MNNQRILEFCERNVKVLLGYIRQRMWYEIDIYDENDILQEVFYTILNGADVNAPIENMTAYIQRIIVNKIMDILRKIKAKKSIPNDAKQAVNEDSDFSLEVSDETFSPDTLYERSEMIEKIVRALRQLPQEQQEVFILNELNGVSFKEISKQSGVSMSTLLARKRYAVSKLRQILQNELT